MQPFTIASTMSGFHKVLESMTIPHDLRADEVYLSSEILEEEETEPANLGEGERWMSCEKVKRPKFSELGLSVTKLQGVLDDASGLGRTSTSRKRKQNRFIESKGTMKLKVKSGIVGHDSHLSETEYAKFGEDETPGTSKMNSSIRHLQDKFLNIQGAEPSSSRHRRNVRKNASNTQLSSRDGGSFTRRDSSINKGDSASVKSGGSNISRASKASRSNRKWGAHKQETPEPQFKCIPLQKKHVEDPDDPIVQKLEKLRIEMQKKEMLRKIDAAENAKLNKKMMKIESSGGGSNQKSMKPGGKGMGLTTDHNGNLMQINRKGIRFIGLA